MVLPPPPTPSEPFAFSNSSVASFRAFLLFPISKVPEGHHPRGTTLREALRGNLPLRGLCGGLSEGSAGSLRGLCGVSAGFCGGPWDFLRVSGGSDPMLVTLGNCWTNSLLEAPSHKPNRPALQALEDARGPGSPRLVLSFPPFSNTPSKPESQTKSSSTATLRKCRNLGAPFLPRLHDLTSHCPRLTCGELLQN